MRTFCGQEEETVCQLLGKCDISQMIWSELNMLFHKNCANYSNVPFSEELVLFGTATNCTTDKPIEIIILLAKFYVYKCKLQGFIPVLTFFKLFSDPDAISETMHHLCWGKLRLQNAIAIS